MNTLRFDALIALAGDEGPFGYFMAPALQHTPHIVAADGGVAVVLKRDFVPQMVVGDGDSMSLEDRNQLKESTFLLSFPSDKDFTDGELATAAAVLLSFGGDPLLYGGDGGHKLYQAFNAYCDLSGKSYLFLNYTGLRHDHQLANIALARLLAKRGAEVYLTDGTTMARIVTGPQSLDNVFLPHIFDQARQDMPATRFLFSAIALDDEVTDLSLFGLLWTLEKVKLPYGRSLALSNRAEGLYPDQVRAKILRGTVMFFTFPENL